MIKLIAKIIRRIKSPVYHMVYTKANLVTESYFVSSPKLKNYFDTQGVKDTGFRAFCYNRDGVRSYNWNGIKTLNKLGLIESLKI
jgi:hypothetical protein